MLLRVSTVLKREANTRCLLGCAHHPSHHQVSNSDDEAWLHWRIWNHRWSQGCENCCEPRGRLNKGGVFRPRFDVHLRDLEKRQNNLLLSRQLGFTVDNPTWHHGPWRSETKTHRRENTWILFLGMWYKQNVSEDQKTVVSRLFSRKVGPDYILTKSVQDRPSYLRMWNRWVPQSFQ